MATSLKDLPEELLATIATHSSTSTLVNLVQTSILWNRVATPCLYHRIKLVEESEQANYQRLARLVTQLIQCPHNAAYIQHVHISGQWPSSPASIKDQRARVENLHAAIVKYLEYHSDLLDGGLDWDALDVLDALIFVLFHLVPNLRVLNISLPEAGRKLSQRTEHFLSNLREVAIADEGPMEAYWGQRFLFDHPKLESVFVYNFMPSEWVPSEWYEFLSAEPMENDSMYMNRVLSMIQSLSGSSPPPSVYARNPAAQHLELTNTRLDIRSLVDLVHAHPSLRTFALDYRKDESPEHDCFFNALISGLSTRADSLTALSIGGVHDDSPPLNFSVLGNLKHLRISLSVFLGSSSNAQSLPDDRMRNRFPASLQKLVILAYHNEEHHILPALQHYIDADPPIIPNLKNLEVCCHAPEAMYAWLHDAAQRHGICLRIFRKLKTKQDSLFIIPFVNTVEGTKREISQVDIKVVPPVSNLLLEDLMPLEEYTHDTEVIVRIFEEATIDAG